MFKSLELVKAYIDKKWKICQYYEKIHGSGHCVLYAGRSYELNDYEVKHYIPLKNGVDDLFVECNIDSLYVLLTKSIDDLNLKSFIPNHRLAREENSIYLANDSYSITVGVCDSVIDETIEEEPCWELFSWKISPYDKFENITVTDKSLFKSKDNFRIVKQILKIIINDNIDTYCLAKYEEIMS